MHAYLRNILIPLALLLCCSLPATAVTTYLSEGPQFTAAVTGTNEFAPGQDAVIAVVIQNSGTNAIQHSWVGGSDPAAAVTRPDLSREYYPWQGSGTINRDDVPTTAKTVSVALLSGDAPVNVKTGPQNIGDLMSQKTATVRFAAKITTDATEGEYTLPLAVQYTYLAASSQLASDVLDSDYQRMNVTIPVTIRIKPTVKISIVGAVPENLAAGTSGYINLTVRNDGFEDGKKATVKLIRNDNSPIIPTDASIYVGDFPRNGTVTCRYRVSISSDAGEQSYPVDAAVSYENRYGEMVTSISDTVGIPIGKKIAFAVVSGPVRVNAGSESLITVRYRNTGSVPAFAAQARLSAVDPFTSPDSNAYIGDMKPGDEADATFRISTAGDAEAKEYDLDTVVRSRDELDTSQISDTFKVRVLVVPASPLNAAMVLLPIAIIVIIAAGAGYYLLVMRKKK